MSQENMLYAISEIKRRYYVGTQAAYKATKTIAQILDTPPEIARRVNREADLSHGYRATPSRLAGINDALWQTLSEVIEAGDLQLDEPGAIQDLADHFLDYGTEDWVYGLGKVPLADSITCYANLFHEARAHSIRNDPELGTFVTETLYDQLLEKDVDFIPDDPSTPAFPVLVRQILATLPWDTLLSQETYQRATTIKTVEALKSHLDLPRMVAQVKRDQVDHRMEYRRQMLSYFLSYEYTPPSVADLIETLDTRRRTRIRRLRKMRKNPTPRVFTERERLLVTEAGFLRHAAAAEKNWIETYLGIPHERPPESPA